jgi:hypothetical protein
VKMNTKSLTLICGLGAILTVPGCNNQKTSNEMTPAEAKSIASDAWVFGMPLVYIGTQVDLQTHTAKPQGPLAPINQFSQYRTFPDASNRVIVGLNVDTLYSLAALDLSEGPIVLSVPEMGKRFWVMQLMDAWNNVFGAPGSRTVGDKGGNFAIVGPDWKGSLPDGVTEIKSPTSLVMIGGRTYTAGPKDYSAVHALQDKYKLVPLSEWGKNYTPPDNVPLKAGVDTKTPVPEQVLAMSPDVYFNRLNALLVNNPPEPADPVMMERIANLGIKPGGQFQLSSFSPEVQKAIQDGIADGQPIMKNAKRGKDVNGWDMALDLGRYGANYPYRASWTFYAVGGNLAEDAVYPFAGKDGDGKPLDGANKYTLHFTKEQLPPVNAFWSVTMYDADSYLVPNPINRYALGDRSGLKYGKDGSLTMYIQSDSPGKDKEANWLPAPKQGGFRLALRLYAPKKEVADGTWTPPPIVRSK